MTKVIGVTGGIACGKSTVSKYLRELGFPVVDADLVARKIVEPGTEGLQQIKDIFGWQYLTPGGVLNRDKLGKLVFDNPEALDALNQITVPLITKELKKEISAKGSLVVLDAALLVKESSYREMADVIWLVTLSPELQLKRLMARNGYSVQQAQARIDAQVPQEEQMKYADGIINNDGTIEETCRQVDELILKLKFSDNAFD